MTRGQKDVDMLDRLLARHTNPSPDRMNRAIDQVGARLRRDADGPSRCGVRRQADGARASVVAVRETWTPPAVSWTRAAAALLALALLVAIVQTVRNNTQATVGATDGGLSRVSDGTTEPLRLDERVGFNEILRTNGAAGAELVLADGSRVEMRSQSELSLERAADGIGIRLSAGSIIVNAAKQRGGHLYVTTKDMTLTVVGTAFLVKADERGSRVAVIEGEVRVEHGAIESTLGPGQQTSTNSALEPMVMHEEIAWSHRADAHMALLQLALSGALPSVAMSPSANPLVPTGGARPTESQLSANACGVNEAPRPANPFDQPYWNGWGGDASQRRFQPESRAQLTPSQVSSLRLKWAFGFPAGSDASSPPVVVGGRLFVGTSSGKVHALSASSGCQIWTFDAEAPVRAAISIGVSNDLWLAYVADERANVYALDALTGSPVWSRRVDDLPGASVTAAPTLQGALLYVATSSSEKESAGAQYECCRFRGSVSALDALTGAVRWKTYTTPDEAKPTQPNAQGVPQWGPAGAPVWGSPAVDLTSRRVYVGTGDAYSVGPKTPTMNAQLAFDADTGKLLSSTPSSAPYQEYVAGPMLVDLPTGLRALIAAQKSGTTATDTNGKRLWRFSTTIDGSAPWGMAADSTNAYVVASRSNATTVGALGLPTGVLRWVRRTECTDSSRCGSGQAAVTVIPGVVLTSAIDGHLRAFATADGELLQDIDTIREYTTINGVKASGGRLNGPIVVGGMLYVNSGDSSGRSAGNVLLAYSVDGR